MRGLQANLLGGLTTRNYIWFVEIFGVGWMMRLDAFQSHIAYCSVAAQGETWRRILGSPMSGLAGLQTLASDTGCSRAIRLELEEQVLANLLPFSCMTDRDQGGMETSLFLCPDAAVILDGFNLFISLCPLLRGH